MGEFRTVVTDAPDRDDLFVEVMWKDQYVAEILAEAGRFMIAFYPKDGTRLELDLSGFLDAIDQARQRLVDRGYGQ